MGLPEGGFRDLRTMEARGRREVVFGAFEGGRDLDLFVESGVAERASVLVLAQDVLHLLVRERTSGGRALRRREPIFHANNEGRTDVTQQSRAHLLLLFAVSQDLLERRMFGLRTVVDEGFIRRFLGGHIAAVGMGGRCRGRRIHTASGVVVLRDKRLATQREVID